MIHTQKNLNGNSIKDQKYLSEELSPLELEIETTKLLKLAFERRNFTVIHSGDMKKIASGNKPDITIFNDNYHINVEVTKTKKSQADREFNSIKAHLSDSIEKNKTKKCFCIYVSPETFKRNMDSFSLFNKDGNEKIIPMNFNTFNYFIRYLIEHSEKYFDIPQLVKLFQFQVRTSSTDADVLEYINNNIIKNPDIEAEIKIQRERERTKKDREIQSNMKKIHNMLRTKYGQNPDEAVKEVSKIIFLKMYEEDKELKNPNDENRCTIKKLNDFKKQGEDEPINYLFNLVKNEMKKKDPDSLIFDDNEKIELDEKTVNKVLELVNGYSFVTMGIDIKGKVYELYLGSTMKNTALGQYFTPEKIIDFIVYLAELKTKDIILDPCCGTSRFLTKSMDCLIDKIKNNPESTEEDIERLKKRQFHGIDLSKAVYKIARMNMYIHGDGKANITRSNMITNNPVLKQKDKDSIDLKGKFTVVLTNPPFGDINIVEDVENFEDYEKQILNEFPEIDTEKIESTSNKNGTTIKSKGYKGGALLLQRMEVMLEKEGKLLTVIDEGMLNTNEYKNLRNFIRNNYFIKAVISLPQTTFKKLAKSSPKASIIYLIKKKNKLDKQEEPIFFAQASMVGIDTRGRPCRNDFDMILKEFEIFSEEIKTNIENHNGFFNKNAFNFEKFSGDPKRAWWNYKDDPELMYYIAYIDELYDRLDFTNNRPDIKEKIEKIKKHGYVKLKDLLKNGVVKGLTPDKDKDKKKEIPLLTIKNIEWDGTINYNDLAYVSKSYFDDRKQQMGVDKGDILLAITGATIGKTAIFNDNKIIAICGDIAKMQLKNKDDIKLIRNFLNSDIGQIQIKKIINGSTNFHLSPEDVDEIIIPELIKKDDFKNTIDDLDIIIKMLNEVMELKEDIEYKKRELISQSLENEDSFEELQKYIKKIKEKFQKLNL